MKKTLTTIVIGGSLLGALFIPLAVTHAGGYYMNDYYGSTPSYMENYYSPTSAYGSGYNYNYNYQYSYNNYPSNSNYGNNYYNQYPENYYRSPYTNYNYSSYYPSQPVYTVSHICGPNSTYDAANDDCDCYPGYISQNNICVLQPVTYSYGNPYGNYGFLTPVAICNDGSVSYSPVGTCWLNGGVRSWES